MAYDFVANYIDLTKNEKKLKKRKGKIVYYWIFIMVIRNFKQE